MKHSPTASQTIDDIPTVHRLVQGDARDLSFIPEESIHLVATSPPYWTLKRYNDSEGQMGHIQEYEQFLSELNRVWREAFRVLVPGGRLVCVVGDVCLCKLAASRLLNENTSLFGHAQLLIELKPHTAVESVALLQETSPDYKAPARKKTQTRHS